MKNLNQRAVYFNNRIVDKNLDTMPKDIIIRVSTPCPAFTCPAGFFVK
jgi:hypothetical protein